jgi:hypothetical protein
LIKPNFLGKVRRFFDLRLVSPNLKKMLYTLADQASIKDKDEDIIG